MEMDTHTKLPQWYDEYRRYMLAVAYRMLGSFAEAEDVVQDVFVRLHGIREPDIRDAKSYLTTMTVRRSLDVLKSARRKRETYVGPWLPEPEVRLLEDEASTGLILEETVSYALLVVMERLTPGERAVFLLQEVHGYSYGETAAALDKTETACRKAMSRVRKKLAQELPEPEADPIHRQQLAAGFLQATQTGKAEDLLAWLQEDAVCMTDGGGEVSAAVKPLVGSDRVAAFLNGLAAKYQGRTLELRPLLVNGELGVGIIEDSVLTTIAVIEWQGDKIRHIYMTRNPKKLVHVPQLHTAAGNKTDI